MKNENLSPPISYAVTKKIIRDRSARIGIVGLGRVGLPLAMLFSESGFAVEGFDLDAMKVEKLLNGQSYLRSTRSETVARARGRGFHATTDLARIADTDVVVLCVPTPLDKNMEPDLRVIRETVFSVAEHLHSGHLVVLEGTTCPGTTEEIVAPILEQANPSHLKLSRDTEASDQIFVAFSPEQQHAGSRRIRRRDIPKVIGGIDRFSTELATDLYSSIFNHLVPVSTPTVAEMSKLLESAYSCVNVAFINEMKKLCYLMGVDPWEVIEAAKTMPFGLQRLDHGRSLTSNSLPTGPFYLSWKAKTYGYRPKFVESAGEFNAGVPSFVVLCTAEALNRHKKSMHGSHILVLGMGYQKDFGDLSESASMAIIHLLRRAGAEVSYSEPSLRNVSRDPQYDLSIVPSPIENISQYDAVLIISDHPSYDFHEIVSEAQLVIDTRNATRGISSDKIIRC